MSKSKEQKLLSQFPPVSTAAWEEVIVADLKGADYEKKLVWRTDEGFNVRPYYRAEDLSGIRYLASQPGQFPFVRGTRRRNSWMVHQTIDVVSVKEANSTALKALAAGTESLGFCMKFVGFSAADLDTLLKGIDIGATELVFCGQGVKTVAEMMIAKARAEKIAPEKARWAFTIDPIINNLSLKGAFSCGPDGNKCIEEIKSLIDKAGEYEKIRFVGVNGHKFGNSGSTLVQELAFTLAVGHEYLARLVEAGVPAGRAAHTIRFSMGVGANYFMEIAKLRAARLLWANIVEQYHPETACAEKIDIHAVTSRWNITAYDPYVNMLRGTTEAMSAALAGIHSLEVTPYDAAYSAPTEFSARIARNVQLLLKNESHFDRVVDPAGGSYYIENLTSSIARNAWELFNQVEAKGGYIEAFKAGFIQDQVETSAANKDKNIATRRLALLGTNQYPNFSEVAPKEIDACSLGLREGASCGCGCDRDKPAFRVLKPYRGAQAFEELRLAVDRSGKNPAAFMLTCGSLAMARARSQFSSNFFACAGIRIIDNNFFDSVEAGVKAALKSKAQIVVLCAADDDYAALAPEAFKLLGGKATFVVAGAPASQPELEAQGIKNFISVRSNVLQTLNQYVKELGI